VTCGRMTNDRRWCITTPVNQCPELYHKRPVGLIIHREVRAVFAQLLKGSPHCSKPFMQAVRLSTVIVEGLQDKSPSLRFRQKRIRH